MSLTPIKPGQNGSRSLNEGLLPEIDAGLEAKQPRAGNSFEIATVPDADVNDGRVIYVSDGSEGSPCAAISDGTNWKVLALGATIAAE